MKKYFLLVLLIITFCLSGCSKVVSTEINDVEVSIVDKYYRSTYVSPVSTGKTVILVTHPATYQINVEYNGVEYTLYGSDTYNKYKYMVGQKTIGVLKKK